MDLNVFNGDTAEFYSLIGCPTTGIKDKSFNNNFALYPNPAHNNITIESTSLNKDEAALIFNLQGQLLLQQSLLQNKTTIDISDFTNGMYFVKMKSNNGIVVKKFVKE